MIFNIFYLSICIFLAVIIGWFFLNAFFERRFIISPERIGMSFGLGLGLITLIEFIFLYFGLKITALNLTLAIAAVLAALFLLINKGQSRFSKTEEERLNLLSKILISFIIIQGIWVLIKTFNLVIFDDDGVCIWGFKAKVIYFSNIANEPLKIIADKMKYTAQERYPLLIPLAENYVNIFLGNWNDLYLKIIFPLYYFALLMVFYSLLKSFTDKNYALVFTFLLSSLSFLTDQATLATADVAFTYYYSISFILFLLWTQNRKNNYLYISAIFLALSIWTKNEGYPSFLINAAIIIIFAIFNIKNNTKDLFKGVAGFLAILIPAVILIVYYQGMVPHIGNTTLPLHAFSFSNLINNANRLPYILNQFQKQLFSAPNKWNLMGYLFVCTFILNFKKAFRPFYLYLFLAIIFNFLLYIIIFIIAPIDVNYYMDSSQNRVLMHFVPLILFFSATLFYSNHKFLSKLR